MNFARWRAGELRLPNGLITIESAGSGSWKKSFYTFRSPGGDRELATLDDLRAVLREQGYDAAAAPFDDQWTLAVLALRLTGRTRHVPPGATLWPDLERHFGLNRDEGRPRVEGGRLTLVTYCIWGSELTVSRVTVDLRMLDVEETKLAVTAWPLRAAEPVGA